MNKKGFSLVELVVVIAIMAVLIGVLVPTLIVHIENARQQKDTSAMSEVAQAVKNSMLLAPVYEEVCDMVDENHILTIHFVQENGYIDIENNNTMGPNLKKELINVIGNTVKISSREFLQPFCLPERGDRAEQQCHAEIAFGPQTRCVGRPRRGQVLLPLLPRQVQDRDDLRSGALSWQPQRQRLVGGRHLLQQRTPSGHDAPSGARLPALAVGLLS